MVNILTYIQWLHTHPETSYDQARLDRIYSTQRIVETATDWEINKSRIETDHSLVSVIITNPEAPFIGKGRWTLLLFLLEDKEFKNTALELSIQLQKDLQVTYERNKNKNPQILFQNYKKEIKREAIA